MNFIYLEDKMVLQTEKELGAFINEWGCYLCSLLAVAEEQRKKTFEAHEVMSIYLAAMHVGIVSREVWDDKGKPADGCTILDPDALLRLAGGKGTVRKVDGSGYQASSGESQVLCFHNPRTGFYHFVVGDGKGKVKWDPLENSVTVREGHVVNQRIIKI
jgi:hypothetical protein